MNPIYAYLVCTVVLVAASLVTLALLRAPLLKLLRELCGADHRGAFWLSYFQVAVVLTVVAVTMFALPESDQPVGFFEVLAMLRFGLLGLLTTLVCLAIVLIGSITAHDQKLAPGTRKPRPEPPR